MIWRRQPPVFSAVPLRALRDGTVTALGFRPPLHNEVSAKLRARYRCHDALLTDSGTSALILALRRIVGPGGTVAYPAYACIDLTAAALAAGVRVRLYDLDPATLSPDLDSLRATIQRGVDAIVVAHLYGYPADVPAVRGLAAEEGIPVLEDAAQGAGGTIRRTLLGSFGDIAVLSFARGKGTTSGSGGAILVRTTELADWTRELRSELHFERGGDEVLKLAAQRIFSHPSLYSLPASLPGLNLGEMVYHPPRSPKAMTATSTAILRRTLQIEDEEISRRRLRALQLLSHVDRIANVKVVRPIPGGESGFLRVALIDETGDRTPRASLGVIRGYPMTLDEHPQLQPLLMSGERAGKGSGLLRDRLFTIPTHARVHQGEMTRVAEWLAKRQDAPWNPALAVRS